MRQNAYIPTSIGPTEDRGDSNTSKSTHSHGSIHKNWKCLHQPLPKFGSFCFSQKGGHVIAESERKKQNGNTWLDSGSTHGVMAGRACVCVRRAFAHTSGSARSAALAREARSPRQVHRNKIASCPDPRLCKQLGVQP